MRAPRTIAACLALALHLATALGESAAPRETAVGGRPLGIAFSVKMTGPYAHECDLQIVCAFQHKPGGDTYIGAMKDLDARLGGLLSSLRDRGDFVGAAGESILITAPVGSIPAKRLLVIGLGEEPALSLDTLRLVGRVAAREAVRLRAQRVAWAPVIRDQGNNTIDVATGDRAFVESVLAAYATELRLQAQGLAEKSTISEWVIEAGPAYFDSAVEQIGQGIQALALPDPTRAEPYSSLHR
jgi:hypothetical protein